MQQKMTTTQIAAKLGVSERTVQRWLKSEKLRAQEITHHQYLVEESDLEVLMLPQHGTTRQNKIAALREEFYELAHQVSELERIMEQIVEALTALPEQMAQTRVTMPLQMEETPSSTSQADARIAALERRVSKLEVLIEAFATTPLQETQTPRPQPR